MKYIVIKIYNTEMDSCSHNESGVATCSTYMGGPYVVQASAMIDTRHGAYKEMQRIIESELDAWKTIGCNDGWEFVVNQGNPIDCIVVNNCQYDCDEYREYPLEAFDILEINETATYN